MSENKTRPTDVTVGEFIATVEPPSRARESEQLDAMFRKVTGFAPRMWGPTIIGYGRYHYRYDSGREGDAAATGFSPRGKAISVYIMPGYADFGSILARLGKHKMGKACLYINKLGDIDMDVLGELVASGLQALNARWPVTAE